MNIDGNPSTAFDGQADEIIAITSIELKDKYILPVDAPTTAGQVIKSTNTQQLIWDTDTAGTGDVVGPPSAVNNNLCSFNGTTGKLIKDSGIPQGNVYIKGTQLDMSGADIINVGTLGSSTSISNEYQLVDGGLKKWTIDSIPFESDSLGILNAGDTPVLKISQSGDTDFNFNNIENVSTIQANVFAGVDMDLRRDDQTGIAGINFSTQDQIPIPRWFLGTDVGNDNLVILNNTANRNVSFSQDGSLKITHTGDTATQEFKDSNLIFNVGTDVNADAPDIEFKRAGGTLSAPTAVAPAKGPLGRLSALGYDGVSYDFGISMNFETRQATWTPTSHPASWSIYSTDLGGTTPTEKLRVDYLGIGIGEGEGVSSNGYLLPLTRGTDGQVLKLGANGFVSWADDGGGGESLQNVYDNSLTQPQIITSVDEGAIEIQQGVGASNDLIRIKDSAGTDVGSISSDGFYTENGLYIGTPSSYNITKETGDIFQIAQSGQDPFILYAPENLFLNKAGGLGNTQVNGGTLLVNTLFQINQLANNGADGVNNIYRRARGTLTTPLPLVATDEISKADYRGYDGSAYQLGAEIITRTPTGFGPSTRETDVEVWTTPPTDLGGPQKNLTIKGNGQILAGKNKTAANPTYSFENHPTDGMYHTGFASVGIASQGQRILEVANAGAIIEDSKYVKLNSSSQDATTANPVIITFIANGAYISGLIVKVVDVGGLPRVEPIAFNDPDSTGVLGVTQTSSGIAGQSVEVAIGGVFLATPANGATINIGDLCEKSDTIGQNGRIVATAPSVGSVLIALSSGTGDAIGSVKVLCMFKKNESF